MNTRLHLVIGFSSMKQKSEPTVIYCGRDATQARDAMVPDPAFAVKMWVRNPHGVRKVNPHFVSGVADSVAASDPGEGDLSGASESPACPPIQQLTDYLEQLTDEQLRESFARLEFAESATREEMVAAIVASAREAYEVAKAGLEAMSDEELDAQAIEAEVTFPEGLTREEKIAILLDGPSSDLPEPDKGASASGNQSAGDGAPPTGSEPDLLAGAGGSGTSPGSMTPGKGKRSK